MNFLCRSFFLISTVFILRAAVPIVPLREIMRKNSSIQYQKCFDAIRFSYKSFPLSINPTNHPNQAAMAETFILRIPNGTVQSYGIVLTDNQYIQELVWKGWQHNVANIHKFADYQKVQIKGRVAVIGQVAGHNYWHWITEFLCRLAMLEMHDIEYDYLYVPCAMQYMVQSLYLWGIDPAKVIVANDNLCIQAEELIVPSMVSTLTIPAPLFACYLHPNLIFYVKEKLLSRALQLQSSQKLSPFVFVSRKDAPQRKILNEDAVFALLQKKGFERYELQKMSVVDQILLFYNAKVIIAPQGTCLANSIFCTPQTKIIELYQGLNDCTFWYASQVFGLNYTPIQTCSFISDYFKAWSMNTEIPLSVIQKILESM